MTRTEQEGAMQTDSDIQKDILAELNAEPNLKSDDIAVGVRDGVVTLAGHVDSFADKWRAERVVKSKG
ncbi:MAG TPA: BON domain-containing protein [Gemmatimonadales bacterium]|nr:BON domain-containing protein [Gemmatimonadales bacterium]